MPLTLNKLPKDQRHNAFTLLELLVVLVIIGVVIAAATIMFSGNRRGDNTKTAIDLFRGRTVLAQQEAILSTSTLGVAISSQGYQFYRYIENVSNHTWSWRMIQNDKVLTYHAWPDDSQVVLQVGNKQNNLLGDVTPSQPQIIFYPSGQITAFKLVVGNQYQVSGNSNGKITAGAANE